jgi:hypothetical protein
VVKFVRKREVGERRGESFAVLDFQREKFVEFFNTFISFLFRACCNVFLTLSVSASCTLVVLNCDSSCRPYLQDTLVIAVIAIFKACTNSFCPRRLWQSLLLDLLSSVRIGYNSRLSTLHVKHLRSVLACAFLPHQIPSSSLSNDQRFCCTVLECVPGTFFTHLESQM